VPQLVSPPAGPHDEQRASRHDYDDQTFHPFQPQPGLARPLIDLDPWCASQHELPSPASMNDADAAKRSVSYFTQREIFFRRIGELADTKLFEKHGVRR
jgi:hypothetical protein